jgi:hypothetical protein
VTEAPIACTLEAGELGDRMELIATLTADALVDQQPIAGGVRSRFRAAAGIEQRLRDLIDAESRCCRFLQFELTRDAGAWTLDITGPRAAEPVIASFFWMPARARVARASPDGVSLGRRG